MISSNNIIIIPSRLGSSRFPNKPLYKINKTSLLELCLINAKKSKLANYVIVATPDKKIYDFVESIGGIAIMTSIKHERASDRCAEALKIFEKRIKKKFDIIAMLQGDEPLISNKIIDKSFKVMEKDNNVIVTNGLAKIGSLKELKDKNCIKVVFDNNFNALYFSRSNIPSTNTNTEHFKQVCIINFRRKILLRYLKLKPTSLEKSESIDMNRLLQHGYKIKLIYTNEKIQSVDVKADVKKVECILNDNS